MSMQEWLLKKPSHTVIRFFTYTLYIMAFLALASFCISPFYTVAINLDHSLPHRFFIIHKGEPVHRGDYVALNFQGYEPWFPKGTIFVKILAGVEGDKVFAHNNDCVEYVVNHTVIGCARTKTKDGHVLRPGPVGIVPRGRFVVRGTSYDSFDSRYAGVGWISYDQVVGRAYPVF